MALSLSATSPPDFSPLLYCWRHHACQQVRGQPAEQRCPWPTCFRGIEFSQVHSSLTNDSLCGTPTMCRASSSCVPLCEGGRSILGRFLEGEAFWLPKGFSWQRRTKRFSGSISCCNFEGPSTGDTETHLYRSTTHVCPLPLPLPPLAPAQQIHTE